MWCRSDGNYLARNLWWAGARRFVRKDGQWEEANIEESMIAFGLNPARDARIDSTEGIAAAACWLVDLVVVFVCR